MDHPYLIILLMLGKAKIGLLIAAYKTTLRGKHVLEKSSDLVYSIQVILILFCHFFNINLVFPFIDFIKTLKILSLRSFCDLRLATRIA